MEKVVSVKKNCHNCVCVGGGGVSKGLYFMNRIFLLLLYINQTGCKVPYLYKRPMVWI